MIRWLVNPLCLFFLVWGTATALYAGGVHSGLFPSPAVLTVASVLLNVLAFPLGYLTWTLFRGLDAEPSNLPAGSGRLLTRDAAARALRFSFVVGVIAILVEMYRLVVIARYFDTTWLELVSHPELFRIRLVLFIGDNLFRTSGVAMLLSITNALFSVGFVLLGVFLYLDRTWTRYFYLVVFLAISLSISLIHLSRYEATSNILYLVLAYCFMGALNRSGREISVRTSSRSTLWASYGKLLVPIVAVVLLFAVIDILLDKSRYYDQPDRFQGFLYQLYWYVASPLAAFNEYVTSFAGDLQWGQNTFFPLYKWLCKLHLAREVEVAIYGEKVLIPYVANTYTYLWNFYEDFGILGVAVAPYVLGWAVAAIRTRARRHFQYLNLYLVLLLFILFSFYNYYLIPTQVYLQVLFGFVLFRYRIDPDWSAAYKETAEQQ